MQPKASHHADWLFVAHDLLHLTSANTGDLTWWCVDRRAKERDRAFVYQPLTGIVCAVEIVELVARHGLCDSYGMATGQVRILKTFDPPIPPKILKDERYVRMESFVRRNFQAKAFQISSKAVYDRILSLEVPKEE
ncbi:MAG TPA: hypothetical protein VN203_23720 [Candidatus Acidoferrum sp.]|nr:hypothetical protein [Candidatus Acidoferrum sp.]